ncbi:OmpP1/FadL family transporter [Rhodobacter sp. NSM]|uniref:OmpP1/FadL family transporter n=1 Tax=Rhodobacter sp. NSM TaxID=3457501 RepID=UPI003FD5AA9E
MKKLTLALGGLALGAGAATAGDIERSTQSVGILFEEGRYAELSFGFVDPEVSGNAFGFGSGNMAGDFSTFALAYKQPLGDRMDLALILDQPIGADVDYPAGGSYFLSGTTAELRSTALTGLLRYKFDNNFSIHGGLRAEKVKGNVHINVASYIAPPIGVDYDLDAKGDWKLGYVLGVAWEKPEIAARVALTYKSKITHTLEYTEDSNLLGGGSGEFDTEVPQSLMLEAQTGIAADTLLFGSIRWVEWSAFLINPPIYSSLFPTTPLVAYDSDRITYTLGLGRKFNEAWSGAVTVSYEPQTDDLTGNLGPNDGYTSIGVGATYTLDRMEITGGVRYVMLGDAVTRSTARFEDNDALAVGIRVGYKF